MKTFRLTPISATTPSGLRTSGGSNFRRRLFGRHSSRCPCLHSAFAIAVLFICVLFLPLLAQSSVPPDTILSVTEARTDANGDFTPDRLGQRITVAGRANVYSGVLHTSRLSVFLQDSRSGIELYNIDPGEPIAEGDSVVASGILEMYEGVTRITHANYKIIKVDRPMPRALDLRVREVPSEQFEGMLIRVHGEITRSWTDAYGAYLTLKESADEPDSIVVFLSFRHKAGIDFSSLSVNDRILVTGVLGQYVRGGPLNSGYEIYPRYPEDIRMEGATSRSYLIAVAVSGGFVILALIWIIAMRRQVSRRTRQLFESEQRFRNLLEGVQLVAVILDTKGRVDFANDYLLSITGWSREEVLGKKWHDFFVAPDGETVHAYEEALKKETVTPHVVGYLLTRMVERRRVAWNITIVHDADGKVLGTARIGEDITERKVTEERLAASLVEKEVLLKEVYHRVKNNLQTVSSVLAIQADSIKDPVMRGLFLENQQRVRSMALIHEKLYRSKTLAQIDFREYLDSLATSLFRTYRVSSNVTLKVDVRDVALDIDTSITCGLLINELLSNSLKHAFPGGRSGEISVCMQPLENGEVSLSFSDTGVGLPAGLVIEKSDTLGMTLISSLVRQLSGTIEISSGPGARFDITFSPD
jgi:PAS domain S-box-containing protein